MSPVTVPALIATSFASRLYGLDTRVFEAADGRKIAYLQRRFIPLPDRYSTVGQHVVLQGERPDLIAFKYLNDAEQFWRIADPNTALRPQELTEVVGRSIRITLPEGLPGTPNA